MRNVAVAAVGRQSTEVSKVEREEHAAIARGSFELLDVGDSERADLMRADCVDAGSAQEARGERTHVFVKVKPNQA